MPFDIVARAAAGRIGRFTTGHGIVTTPTLLPVINPNIDLVAPEEMRRFGCEMVITNSYVIHKHERLREAALRDGVGTVIGWDGPVMTDSGTFQMYVYGDVEVGPREIVEFQARMGVDVATCLDVFVTPDMGRAEAESAVATTLERTRLSDDALARHRQQVENGELGPPAHGLTVLNTTVQGGVFPELRQQCAAAYRGVDAGYSTIGGVVPLMERQMYPELVAAILHSQAQLRKDRPVHLFGAGHPLVFPLATALGCDVFDSSSYAKYAKDGRIMTPEATLHVEDLEEWPFSSAFLDPWTPKEIHNALKGPARGRAARGADADLLDDASRRARIAQREADDPRFAAERALAMHNLAVCFADLRRIREAIRQGVLWELVEQRAAAHPLLAAATRKLGDPVYQHWLEAREPLSGAKAMRYTGSLTHHRPVFARIRDRLVTRFTPLGEVIDAPPDSPYAHEGEPVREAAMHKEPASKPFGAGVPGPFDADQDHVVINALGPTPLGLDEAYPFAQSVLPRLDGLERGHMAWVGQTKDVWLHVHGLVPGIPGPGLPGQGADADLLQVLRTADWQFGAGAGAVLAGLLTPAAVRDAWAAAREARPGGDAASAPDESATPVRARVAGRATRAQDEGATLSRTGSGTAPGSPDHAGPDRLAAVARTLAALLPRPARSDRLRCERSKATGKMRTVHLDGEHVVSLRAQDGLFTLKPAGAALLHAAFPPPAMRVVAHDDSVPFNREGKSVFAQFVQACDPQLRPGDECIVTDAEDRLIAVGQLLLAPDEIGDFQRGAAVKVRDGFVA